LEAHYDDLEDEPHKHAFAKLRNQPNEAISELFEFRRTNILKLVFLHTRRRLRYLQAFTFYKLRILTLSSKNTQVKKLKEQPKETAKVPNREKTPLKTTRSRSKSPTPAQKDSASTARLSNKHGDSSRSQIIKKIMSSISVGTDDFFTDDSENMRAKIIYRLLKKKNGVDVNLKQKVLVVWRTTTFEIEKRALVSEMKKMEMIVEEALFNEQQSKVRLLYEKTEIESKINELANLMLM